MTDDVAEICMVSSLHPANDKRVYEKELLSLVGHGYRVVHIAPRTPDVEGTPEHCILYEPGRNRIVNSIRMMRELRKLRGVRAIHANELDSCLFAIPYALRTKKVLVFDIHEDYTGEIELRFPPRVRPFVRLAVDLVQRMLTAFATHSVLAKRTLRDALPWLDDSSSTVVANYAPVEAVPQDRRDAERLHLVHAGLMSRERCWPLMLELLTMPGLEHATLEFVGTFNDPDPDAAETRAHELGVADRVTFTGWVARPEMMARLGRADVGLLFLSLGNRNHVRALPHKVFDYMTCGLPVIVPAHCEELVPMVEEHRCGIVVPMDEPESIRDALVRLAVDPDLRVEMGRRGVDAVAREYNWDSQAEKLAALYGRLLESDRRHAGVR